jgi:PAS domain S-box-containing protein
MSGSVYIINADPNEIGALSALLDETGLEVGIARSGEDGVAGVLQSQPDVAIVAAELPDMDGLAVCEALQTDATSRHVPVILLGSTPDLASKVAAFERGAIDFVARPYEFEEIVARAKRQVTVSRIRAALQKSEAEFQSVTQSAIDAIISADAKGLIRSWNPAATRLFGHREEEVLGQNLDLIIPDRFRGPHHEGIGRVSAGGESRVIGSTVEVAAIHRDGQEVPVELSLATWTLDGDRYYTGILRDISERKEAEQKFRSVTESAIDAIVSADYAGLIVAWNSAARHLFGWTEEETVGELLEMIIPERFRDLHRNGIDRMSATGESRVIGQTVELAALHKEGREFPIELSLSTWMVEKDRFYTGIIRDISERKEAEEQLKRYADELERKHAELQEKHDELERSREALTASFKQAQRLFSTVTDGLPGAVLNQKYRLERKIAAGGFGVVYEATQIALERRVAVKLLRPPTGLDEEAMFERFRREGITTSRVNHLNAVAVLDVDVSEGGFPYIVMEYLEGQTVGERLHSGGMDTLGEAVGVAADVCAVLAASHRAGVIHRDIKPSNIFLQRVGESENTIMVKVVDFGVAKLMDEPGRYRVTQTGELLGTPSYMAPERLTGSLKEGPESDIFSVGVVLYEMLTGELPISVGQDLVTTIHKQLHTDPTPLSDYLPMAPQALCDLVNRAMARKAEDRPTPTEMERELRELQPELEELDVPTPGSQTLTSPMDSEALTLILDKPEDEDA